MRLSKSLLVIAAVGLVSSAAFAGDNGSTLQGLKQPIQVLKIKNTVFVSGNGESATLTAGTYTPIDSGTTFTCKKTCTISATASIQYEAGTSGTEWAIATLVDGSAIQSQYQRQDNDTFWDLGNVQAAVSLGAGSHTVQTEVYVSNTSVYAYYAMTYAMNY